MEKLRTLIVDDEELARRGIYLRLRKIEDVQVVGECCNGRQALSFIHGLDPDLVFLDIQMPGMDGFEVVSSLQQADMPAVVFVTAFDQFAVRAFDVHAVDYLLKPVDDQRLVRTLERARRHKREKKNICDKRKLLAVMEEITGKSPAQLDDWLNRGGAGGEPYPDRISIRDGSTIKLVPVNDIDWIDAAGDYMCLHAGSQVHVLRVTMKALQSQLDPQRFQRVHRSTIVNVDRVQTITPHQNGEYHLHLQGGKRLKMSRSYKNGLQKLIHAV
jgi:two-component system LytT family response regulator